MKGKLLILGGGTCQLNGVLRAKQMGLTVGVADYTEDSPGKTVADFSVLASTFDPQACLDAGRSHRIGGIMTLGTDQPILTCAEVAQQMGLPSFLSVEQAKAVTNKKIMKAIFTENRIPTVPYAIIGEEFGEQQLAHLSPPYVVKPLDSQGQRGVYLLESARQIHQQASSVLSYSREQEFLVEQHYPSTEITVSGWVDEGKTDILTVTDRGTFEQGKHIGICSFHRFPSVHLAEYYEEICRLTHELTKAFGIWQGPVYYQMLVGREGIKVNEVAARIGGAFEDIFIPKITGVPILDMVIRGSMGQSAAPAVKSAYTPMDNPHRVSVDMIFLKEGTIGFLTPMEQLLSFDGVLGGGYNVATGQIIPPIESAAQRAAYLIVHGNTQAEHEAKRKNVFANWQILGRDGEQLIMDFPWLEG